MNTSRIIEVMKEVAKDVEKDAADFDGRPFDGKTVAAYMGNHGAAIQAIAKAVVEILESTPPNSNGTYHPDPIL